MNLKLSSDELVVILQCMQSAQINGKDAVPFGLLPDKVGTHYEKIVTSEKKEK